MRLAVRATLADWFPGRGRRGRRRRSVLATSSRSLRLRDCVRQRDRYKAMPSGRSCGGDGCCGHCPVPARRFGSINERRLSKPSAVTTPAATSSQSAVSISAFNFSVPRTMSAKNDAPAMAQKVEHLPRPFAQSARVRIGSCGLCGDIQSASSRTKNVIGATLVGITLRFLCGPSTSLFESGP